MRIFTKTELLIYIILSFIWDHVQIILAFLFTCFFSKSRTALVLTSVSYFYWTPFAFYRALWSFNNYLYSMLVEYFTILILLTA